MAFNFGSTAAAPAASTGFSFGSATTTPAAAPAATGGFSFGGGAAAAPAAAAPASSGGFSFGGTTTTAPAASGGFNFGGTTTTTPAASGGFSFGGATTAPTAAAPAPAASGGFSFGGTTTTAPATSGGFSFGGTTTTAPATSGGFSFGGTTTTAPATSGGFSFGGGNAAPSSAFSFGSGASTGAFGTLGQPQQQQQQAQPPQQPAITLETVFDSLPADIKTNIAAFHRVLRDEDQSDAFLKSVSARQLDAVKNNLTQLEQDVLVRRNLQDQQATAVQHVRKDVKHLIHQVDTATLQLRSLSGESTSQRFYGITRRVEMPSGYYWELLDQFEARMHQIKSQIEGVEAESAALGHSVGGGGNSSRSPTPRHMETMDAARLQQLLVAQNTALMQVAAHVAEVHDKTEEMRSVFIRKMKADLVRHGETNPAAFKNPFDKKTRSRAARESDIDNIRFKTRVAPTIVAAAPAQATTVAAPATSPTPTTGFGGFGSSFGGFGAASTAAPTASTSTTPSSSLFGGSSTGATTTATTTTTPGTGFGAGGFSFGGSTAASTAAPASTTTAASPSVSFNLGGLSTPTGTAATTAATPTTPGTSGFSFGAAAPAATDGFGAGLFGATANAGDKRSAGASGSKSLRARQKKR